MKKIAIHWFRQDLRLSDNPSLTLAARHQNILPIYILDDEHAGEYAMGAASRWWLHHSLHALNISLGGNLSIYKGDPTSIFCQLIKHYEVEAVYWNRCYEPWRIDRDKRIKLFLNERNIQAKSTNGSLLWEPWTIKKTDGSSYKVFTPFFQKGCLRAPKPREPLASPTQVNYLKDHSESIDLEQLHLLPNIPWDEQINKLWQVGELAAQTHFDTFIEQGLCHYKDRRNLPAQPYVSRLSPHLHFGEISPNQLWYGVLNIGNDKNIEHFCSELGWREFSYTQLYHYPNLPSQNLQDKFDGFPWVVNKNLLAAWQQGKTGIPMVDAGMRELWQTGYMHNRVRMIVGSFLVKNLRLHWHHGERWFWDTLLDADLANNSASWQWIAGCGFDAAPYFRIFNPVKQGQTFDPNGDYVKKFIPEIASLPVKYIFNPWEAPQDILIKANIILGQTYPKPIVDLKASREAALSAFKSLKQEQS